VTYFWNYCFNIQTNKQSKKKEKEKHTLTKKSVSLAVVETNKTAFNAPTTAVSLKSESVVKVTRSLLVSRAAFFEEEEEEKKKERKRKFRPK